MSSSHSCYVAGVRIRTSGGEASVETIKAGDLVVAMRDGQKVLEPVTWVGYSDVDLSRTRHVEDSAPIRFRAGALADSQPIRDLVLSPRTLPDYRRSVCTRQAPREWWLDRQ